MTDTTSFFDSGIEEEVDASSSAFFKGEEDETPPQQVYADEGTKPDRRGARVSGERTISTAWFGLGGVLVSKRIDPPVGRVLQLEAPLAAKEIDKAIAGTFLDRILQPIFRRADQMEGLGALLAVPIMVGLYERKPEWAPLLEGPMKQALEDVVLDVAPLMRREKTKVRNAARSLSDVHAAFNIPLKDENGNKVDPVDFLFKAWVFQDYDHLQEEPNVTASNGQ